MADSKKQPKEKKDKRTSLIRTLLISIAGTIILITPSANRS